MAKINFNGRYNNAEARVDGEYRRLESGGYICVIKNVIDVPEKEYLKILIDIAEGDFKNYFNDLYEKYNNKWSNSGTTIRSYSEKSINYFKGMMSSIEQSNAGFVYTENTDIMQLIGKKVGVVFGEEEYLDNQGIKKIAIKPRSIISTKRIEENDYTLPAIKALSDNDKQRLEAIEQNNEFVEVDTANLPF